MKKVYLISLMVIVIIIAGSIGYFLGKKCKYENANLNVNNNININQNNNVNVNIARKVPIEENFTINKDEIVSIENYDINLELLDTAGEMGTPFGEFSAEVKFTGNEVINGVQKMQSENYGNYLDLGKLRYLLMSVNAESATLQAQKRFLSEADYFCTKSAGCMPIIPGGSSRFCDDNYINWASKNCPGFEVTY